MSIYKVMIAGDLHKRPTDISTIRGYVKCCDAVQDALIDAIKEKGITHFISLGDWYDKGYVDDVSAALSDVTKEIHMHNLLNGNFYGVIGNHIRLKLDSNPEFNLIQPHPTMKPKKPVEREVAIIKTPQYLMLGNIQISLVHHQLGRRSVTEYSIYRMPEAKYHIALVHDPLFIPNSQMVKAGIPTTVSLDSDIGSTLRGVDLCICGDIHKPLGLFKVFNTNMYVPGSLTNTNAGINTRHGSIKIPIITIDDETDSVNVEYMPFDLKINMLTFDDRSLLKAEDKLKTLRGNPIDRLYEGGTLEGVLSKELAGLSLSAFLKDQHYTEADKNLIRGVRNNPQDLTGLIAIHKEDI